MFLRVAIVAFTAFFTLLLVVRRNPRMERDVVATIRVQRLRHPLLTVSMRVVSWFGFRPQSLALPATAVAGTWLAGFRREARYLVFAWLGSLISYTTKRFVRRPRPSGEGIIVQLADLRDSSFPSGHTAGATLFYGFVAAYMAWHMPDAWRRAVSRCANGRWTGKRDGCR